MKSNYNFLDTTDMADCRRYLANKYEVNDFDILLNGDRSFSFKVPEETAFSIYGRMNYDKRLHYPELHIKGSICTVSGTIIPKEEV